MEEKVFVFFHKDYCNIVLLSPFFLVNDNETSFFQMHTLPFSWRQDCTFSSGELWRPRGLNTTERA